MPCSHGYRSPQEIHDAYMSVAHREVNVKSIGIFGHTAEEIITALDLAAITKAGLNKDQINMTREEAKRKVEKVCGLPLGHGNIIDALEALGLLKFDEMLKSSNKITESLIRSYQTQPEQTKDSPTIVIAAQLNHFTAAPMILAGGCVNALMKAGYKIVDTDACAVVDLGSNYRVCIKQDDNIVGIEGNVISITELDKSS